MKPRGLWLSYDQEWKEWCDAEGFATCNMDTCYIYSANLQKDSLCIIDSLESLDAFQEKYQNKSSYIDWHTVAQDYDGISFENYYDVKKAYLYTSKSIRDIWILGVDVNSVCIWNPSKVIKDWACERTGREHTIPLQMTNDSSIRFQVHATV
jgi:hypothetical protein